MRKTLVGYCVVLVAIVVSVSFTGRVVTADDKGAKPLSARELGKEWRYPGTGNDADIKGDKFVWEYWGPLGQELKNLDRTTMQFGQPKASFEDVWNFYSGKCGYDKKWKKNHIHAVIEQTKDGGQRMVIDQTQGQLIDSGGKAETHFGLFTEKYVIHVEVRKVDDERTAIRILTTIR